MEKEVTLGEILMKLMNGKKLILMFTLSVFAISSIVSYAVIPPVYEVSTFLTLNLASSDQNPANEEKIQTSVITQSVQLLDNSTVMNRVIQQMQSSKYTYSPQNVKKNVTLKPSVQSKTIQIKVSGNDPEQVTHLANVISHELGAYIDYSFELSSVPTYREKLKQIEDQLRLAHAEKLEAERQLQHTPMILKTTKSLASDPYLQSIVTGSQGQSSRTSGALKLENEELNPVYLAISSKISETTVGISKILSEKQNVAARLQQSEQNIEQYQKSDIAINQPRFAIIAPAIIPEDPVSPNKMLIVSLSTFGALIVGAITVLFREYMKEYSEMKLSLKG